jgi:hypothetical protein
MSKEESSLLNYSAIEESSSKQPLNVGDLPDKILEALNVVRTLKREANEDKPGFLNPLGSVRPR